MQKWPDYDIAPRIIDWKAEKMKFSTWYLDIIYINTAIH